MEGALTDTSSSSKNSGTMQLLMHVAIETVVIGGVTWHFKRRTDGLETRIEKLEEELLLLKKENEHKSMILNAVVNKLTEMEMMMSSSRGMMGMMPQPAPYGHFSPQMPFSQPFSHHPQHFSSPQHPQTFYRQSFTNIPQTTPMESYMRPPPPSSQQSPPPSQPPPPEEEEEEEDTSALDAALQEELLRLSEPPVEVDECEGGVCPIPDPPKKKGRSSKKKLRG